MAKLLIVSHDIIADRMAGVGIRYFEVAQALRGYHDITLAAPAGSTLPAFAQPHFGGKFRVYRPDDLSPLADLLGEADIVFAYPDMLWRCQDLIAQSGVAVAVDGYDIALLEHLEMDQAHHTLEEQMRWQQAYQAMMGYAMRRGDIFLVATERQRDWWLGSLAAAGRINALTRQNDPSLRRLVGMLPYGIPDAPPRHARAAMRGVIDGIGPSDKIVLWGGGVWEWLDPLTAIRAAALVAQQRPDIKFVFPGVHHPASDLVQPMPVQQQVADLARSLELLDRVVFLGRWAAYEDWPNYLVEADIGISLHHDHLEAHLSARTRVLSYIWAGLPMVLTRGDELAQVMAGAGVATLVEEGDAAAVATAILRAAERPKADLGPMFDKIRPAHYWSNTVTALRQFCDHATRAADYMHMANTPIKPNPIRDETPVPHPPQPMPLPLPLLPSLPPLALSPGVSPVSLPEPTTAMGQLLAPALKAGVLWYLTSTLTQQNGINTLLHQRVVDLQGAVNTLIELSVRQWDRHVELTQALDTLRDEARAAQSQSQSQAQAQAQAQAQSQAATQAQLSAARQEYANLRDSLEKLRAEHAQTMAGLAALTSQQAQTKTSLDAFTSQQAQTGHDLEALRLELQLQRTCMDERDGAVQERLSHNTQALSRTAETLQGYLTNLQQAYEQVAHAIRYDVAAQLHQLGSRLKDAEGLQTDMLEALAQPHDQQSAP